MNLIKKIVRTFGLAWLIVLAGCTQIPMVGKPAPDMVQSENRAQTFKQNRNYVGAAQEYLRLAEQSSPPQSYKYSLHAADALILDKKMQDAAQILAQLQIPDGYPELVSWKNILDAQTALAANDYRRTLSALREEPAANIAHPLQRRYYEYKAIAYGNLADYLEETHYRVLLDPFLTNATEKEENQRATWSAASRIQASLLSRYMTGDTDILNGWLELAFVTKTQTQDATAYEQALSTWKQRYPTHPANYRVYNSLLEKKQILDIQAENIALLLPFSGQFASAAAALRDGFITAWYQDSGNPDRPIIKTYEANSSNVNSIYRQALENNADFVVGPLEKPAIKQLVDSHSLSIPTLVLNEVDQSGHDLNLYQFGLTPENEAEQVAEKAWNDGHQRVLILTPEGEWGDRIGSAFRKHWEKLGGSIAEQRTYDDEAADFTFKVRELLDINDSEKRLSEMENVLQRDVKFKPHSREDVDCIFLAGFSKQAKAIYPLIQQYNSTNKPVYSTSHINASITQGYADQDLNGLIFGEMPLLLDSSAQSAWLRNVDGRSWPADVQHLRLFSMGIDAYQIIPQIGRLRIEPLATYIGQTGILRVTETGIIQRKPKWAVFSNGLARQIP